MRAIALISGGLDSILAARVVQEEGISVLPVNFKIPFCPRKKTNGQEGDINSFVKKNLGEALKVVDISAGFLESVLKNPKYGFGANMNPCIDCKIFMLKSARELMALHEAQFVVTGEVLGQRPMSQHRRALDIIEKESGLSGLLLRPLCAGVLPETLPEKEGWLKRERLFKFNGRERRPQMELAEKFSIDNYPNPAGGCLLTDRQFSRRLRDLLASEGLSVKNVELLKIGRHFRLSANAKLIVGRNKEEDKELEARGLGGDYLFMPDENTAGPTCLGKGEFNSGLIYLSSRIASYYCDPGPAPKTRIIYYPASSPQEKNAFEVLPLGEDRLKNLRL